MDELAKKRDYARRAFEAKRHPAQDQTPERRTESEPRHPKPPAPQLVPGGQMRRDGIAHAEQVLGQERADAVKRQIEEARAQAAQRMQDQFKTRAR